MSNFSEYSYNYFERCVNCGNTEFRQMGKGTDRTNKFHKQVVECKNCKLLFTNPIADRRSMQLYYSTYGSTHPRALDISQKQMLFAKEVTEQFSNAEKCLRFLDVGAASGEIMQAFKMQGWEVYGIELSESYIQFIKEKRNLENVYSCEIEDAPFPANNFDFINFWHVIEHLRDPIIVLKKIYSWLKPGGKVNIGTPNPTPFYLLLSSYITAHFDLGIDHTFGFPPKVFEDILNEIGFIVKMHRVYNNPDKRYSSKKTELMRKIGLYKTMQQIIAQKPAI